MKRATIIDRVGRLAPAWVAGVVGLSAAAAAACPTCSEAIKGDPVALSFYWSTLFMIAMPYALILGVGGGLAFVYWRAARNAAQIDSADTMSWSARGPEKEGGR
jgi:hypothetical protein